LGVGRLGFYTPFGRRFFYHAEITVHKKGGVNDLGKLRFAVMRSYNVFCVTLINTAETLKIG
jgi:hypothetical protein